MLCWLLYMLLLEHSGHQKLLLFIALDFTVCWRPQPKNWYENKQHTHPPFISLFLILCSFSPLSMYTCSSETTLDFPFVLVHHFCLSCGTAQSLPGLVVLHNHSLEQLPQSWKPLPSSHDCPPPCICGEGPFVCLLGWAHNTEIYSNLFAVFPIPNLLGTPCLWTSPSTHPSLWHFRDSLAALESVCV